MAAGGKIRMIRYKIRMMSLAAEGKIRMIRLGCWDNNIFSHNNDADRG